MTKMKSKKMTKSTFAIIIMAIAMVAMLAFGGTYAYFTASATSESQTVTTATVQLAANTVATVVDTNVASGQSLIASGKYAVTDQSDIDVWVFVQFNVTLTKDNAEVGNKVASKDLITKDGDYCLEISNITTYGWAETSTTGVYAKLVKTTDASQSVDVCEAIKFYGWSESTPDATGSLMGATITISLNAFAIQDIDEADGAAFATADEALAAFNGQKA